MHALKERVCLLNSCIWHILVALLAVGENIIANVLNMLVLIFKKESSNIRVQRMTISGGACQTISGSRWGEWGLIIDFLSVLYIGRRSSELQHVKCQCKTWLLGFLAADFKHNKMIGLNAVTKKVKGSQLSCSLSSG